MDLRIAVAFLTMAPVELYKAIKIRTFFSKICLKRCVGKRLFSDQWVELHAVQQNQSLKHVQECFSPFVWAVVELEMV